MCVLEVGAEVGADEKAAALAETEAAALICGVPAAAAAFGAGL